MIREQFYCPWCGDLLADLTPAPLTYTRLLEEGGDGTLTDRIVRIRARELEPLEYVFAEHLRTTHPIRRRLSRRVRAALRLHEDGTVMAA